MIIIIQKKYTLFVIMFNFAPYNVMRQKRGYQYKQKECLKSVQLHFFLINCVPVTVRIEFTAESIYVWQLATLDKSGGFGLVGIQSTGGTFHNKCQLCLFEHLSFQITNELERGAKTNKSLYPSLESLEWTIFFTCVIGGYKVLMLKISNMY